VKSYLVIAFDGNCRDALALYQRAFNVTLVELVHYKDMKLASGAEMPYKNMLETCSKDKISSAVLKFGNMTVQLTDFPEVFVNQPTERISICINDTEENIRRAYSVLGERGMIAVPLQKNMFSDSHAMIMDEFGVLWVFNRIDSVKF
jgi:PhnB protein